MRHVLVLGDQLTRDVGPLAGARPSGTTVLMIESSGLASSAPHHKQKLVLVFTESGADALTVMTPSDHGYEARLGDAARRAGARLDVVPNKLWLTDEAEFDSWARGRKTLRLEYFYRAVRKRRGWLMDGAEPLGGRWNYDADNRRTPEAGHHFPGSPGFAPDALTRAVIEEVEAGWPDHFGSTEGFAWPVTRAQALEALDDFLRHRLARFGPFEDAMVEGESVLYHSLLSVPLTLGLLHPHEVCTRAMAFAAEPANGVPIQSIEGFLRQILGWREFVRHVYRTLMPELRDANGLGHDLPLPSFYWGAPTGMRCVGQAVAQLQETGHTHHIQRLMVLGNVALIARVDPRELNEWFLTCYADALDWDFVDHHAERWRSNPRMALIVKSWERRDPEVRREILARAAVVRERLREQPLDLSRASRARGCRPRLP